MVTNRYPDTRPTEDDLRVQEERNQWFDDLRERQGDQPITEMMDIIDKAFGIPSWEEIRRAEEAMLKERHETAAWESESRYKERMRKANE